MFIRLTPASILRISVISITTLTPFAVTPYPIDCAIFLCLAGGWPNSPDCNVARVEFIRRITPLPVEPPLQLWRCPMGASAGFTDLSPMQRLQAIKDTSANPAPELPTSDQDIPKTVEASYSADAWNALGAEVPALPGPIPAAVDLSSSDFDIVRSIRVIDVRHYSYEVREREGPCETRLDVAVGTYDADANFQWSDRASGGLPNWLPLRKQCPSSFRGVGVEWTDTFGRHDYELVPY